MKVVRAKKSMREAWHVEADELGRLPQVLEACKTARASGVLDGLKPPELLWVAGIIYARRASETASSYLK